MSGTCFAVKVMYFTISLLFWFGTRSRPCVAAQSCKIKDSKTGYTIFSLGWTGSTRSWHHYEFVYIFLPDFLQTARPLGTLYRIFDFAVFWILPGWHTTIFHHISLRVLFSPVLRWCLRLCL